MCAGALLAYRELYLTFLRMVAAFEIVTDTSIETHPVKGVADLTNLVSMPREYEVRFVPRNQSALQSVLEAKNTYVLDFLCHFLVFLFRFSA